MNASATEIDISPAQRFREAFLPRVLSALVAALFVVGFLLCPSVWGQGTIAGTVTDSTTGNSLPGVNVTVVGTQQGTATNASGEYTISGLEPGTYTVRASFVGYQASTVEGVEVSAGETTTADLMLRPSTVALEDVVVTALGVEREERSLTYGTEEVNTAAIAETRELNPINFLSGKVAGLSISPSGTGVGASSRVLLRGNRSITGSSQPLYVVDGVPVSGDISHLSPDVIQSINVLKGPNAAALYGSEAQNGAIVVTTKQAEAGEVNVSFSSNVMARDPIMLIDYQNEYGQGSGGEYNRSLPYSWGPRMEGQRVQHWSSNPELADTQIPYAPQPDNVSDQFQTGYNASTTLTASVGRENTRTLFNYTFTSGRGVVPNNALQRHNVNLRVTNNLTDNLSLNGKLSYMREDVDYRLNTGEGVFNAVQYMYRTPRNIRTEDMADYAYTDPEGNIRQNTWTPGNNRGFNGYWAVNNMRDQVPSEQILGLGSLTYDFTDLFSLMIRASYDGSSSSLERHIHNDTGTTYSNGLYSTSRSESYEWNGDFLLSYTQDLSEDWHVDANVGGSIKRERNSGLSANTGIALTVPNFFTISNTQNVITTENIGAPRDVQSVYAFAQVGWRDAVYLDLTGRNDWSSTLPADSRSYFYPSVGVSAVLSDLVPLPDVVSFAKVRGSWAQVGNSAAPFQLQRTASFSAGGNNGYLRLSPTIPNADLRPEETVSRELGLDMRFFGDRLGVQGTVYRTNTRNQLFTVALPVGSGASSFYTNGGNVENEGVEVLLEATPVQTERFRWDLNTNFSANRNTVVSISDERPILTLSQNFLRAFRVVEGDPFGQIYSRGFERDDQGRIIVGSNGVPQITDGMTVQVANYSPDWTGGIQSTFTWNHFDLSVLVEHRQGGSMVSFTDAILYAEGLTEGTLVGRENGLVFGEDVFADETAVTEDGSPNDISVDPEVLWRNLGGRNAPVGEAFVESGTNTRLRELTVGYTFAQPTIVGLPLSSLRVSLVGRNLFFLHRASDSIDPDVLVGTGAPAEGLSAFAPPTTRTFGANLQLIF